MITSGVFRLRTLRARRHRSLIQRTDTMSSDYRDLRVWSEAVELALQTYKLTLSFPKEELYGLTSHMRRAAVSVPSNVAEGHGRSTAPPLHRSTAPLLHCSTALLEVSVEPR